MGCAMPGCIDRRRGSPAAGARSHAPRVHRMNEGSPENIQSTVGWTIEQVARESYGRLVAYLSVHTHDLAGAEDALSAALVAALETWPRDGVPQNPQAWLLTAARRSLIDVMRHHQVVLESEPILQFLRESSTEAVVPTMFQD